MRIILLGEIWGGALRFQDIMEKNSRDESITVDAQGLHWRGEVLRTAVGWGGIGVKRREGDGITPAGFWPLRRVWYRKDRCLVETGLPVVEIAQDQGWCDDPEHRSYNLPVKLPFEGRCERLWRQDGCYDVVVELGYNDAPVRPGAGSAIFLHVACDDFSATEGCIGISLRDMLRFVPGLSLGSRLRIG